MNEEAMLGGRRAGVDSPSRRDARGEGRLAGLLLTGLAAFLILAALAATVGPRFLPYRTYAVLSGSMTPTIPVGALVVALPTPAAALRVGDIVTFARPDRPSQSITHRIVDIEQTPSGPVLRTRGDANSTPDDWKVPASGTAWKTAARVPLAGYVLVYLATPLGQLLSFFIPVLLLAGMAFQDLLWSRPGESRRPRP